MNARPPPRRRSRWTLPVVGLQILAGLVGAQYLAVQRAQQSSDWLIGRARPWIDARYESVWSWAGGGAHGEAVSARPGPLLMRDHAWLGGSLLTAPRVIVDEYRRYEDGTPELLRVEVPEWTLELPPQADLLAEGLPTPRRGIYPLHLRRLGYTRLSGSATLEVRFVPEARALTVRWRARVEDFLDWDLHFELDTDRAILDGIPDSLGLRFLELQLGDLGLMGRYRDRVATERRLSLPAAEAALVRPFDQWAERQDMQWSPETANALRRFLRGGARLRLRMDPLADIALRDYELYAERDWPVLLGLEASAETLAR